MHCQGGKGRTGTFCAALLLWTGFCSTADEALDIYARRRTDPRLGRRRRLQGVDSPSQRRYVRYIERAIHSDRVAIPPPARRTLLTSITVTAPPARRGTGRGAARVGFMVESLGTVQYDLAKRLGAAPLPDPSDAGGRSGESENDRSVLRFELEDGVLVAGDMTVRFFLFEDEAPLPPAGGDLGQGARTVRYGAAVGRLLCFVTLHTAFHKDGEVLFPRAEIDGAYNQPEEAFPTNFAITLTLNSSIDALANAGRSQPMRSARRTPPRSSLLAGKTRCPSKGGSDCDSLASGSDVSRGGGVWLPYGLGVGRRRLRLHAAVEAVFAGACPELLTFRRGERVWRDGGCGERRLCLIVGGVVEYGPAAEGEPPPWINRGDSLARLQVSLVA